MVMTKTKTKTKTKGVMQRPLPGPAASGNGGPYKRGLWSAEEDKILVDYVMAHGMGHWNLIPKRTGLKRCGKSCRLRWMNYLNPNVKRGSFNDEEEDLIIRLHRLLGNRWSLIAKRVPGRTDNQVKNHWNTHLSKKLKLGVGLHNQTSAVSESPKHNKSISKKCTVNAVKESSQNSNQLVGGNLFGDHQEADCVKSFWDFDHELNALDMAELLQGYPNNHNPPSWTHS